MFKRKKYDYDLLIIGTGAGGSVSAHFAASIGKKVAIFEKGKIGGECPNIGCVPTKALLYASDIYENIKKAKNFGIEVKGIKVDFSKMQKWKDLAVERTGASHGEQSFAHDKIHLIMGEAKFISPHELEVEDKIYSGDKIIIATGSSVFIPPIAGLSETGYITFEQAIDFKKLPKSIFILGGGPIGCEFAQYFSSFGVKVILADSLPKLIAKEDREISELIQGLFEYRGVEILTNITVTRVDIHHNKKTVHFSEGSSQHYREVDEILVATGKKPNLNLDLEKAGIKLEGRLKVNKYLQTNVKHIYASGDVIGPFLFTHTGYYQSYIATHNAFSRKKIGVDYSVVPRCVFTNPEIASVGISELQAKEQGIKIKKGITPISILGRANTSNEFDGFVKILTDKKGKILGGSIISPRAGEMIHEIALAIKLKARALDLAEMMHAYPTFSEAIKIACSNLQ